MSILAGIKVVQQQPESDISAYAKAYAKAGLDVFPLHSVVANQCLCGNANCGSKGKHPLTINGVRDASRDPSLFDQWFKQWPNANLGMALDQLVVVDVDPRNGGDITFEKLVSEHGAMPDTWVQRTGGGGNHYVFKARPGVTYRGAIGAGVDLKHGRNQYIVVEPSIHQAGNKYVWLDESGPMEGGTLAEAPLWLSVAKESAKVHQGPNAGKIGSGQRNNYLYQRARRLRDQGFSQGVIFAAISALNDEECVPPLDAAEVRTIAKSAAQNDPETKDSPFFIDIVPFVQTITPPVWLVDGMIQRGFVYSLTAQTNHGKTALATTLALCVASGKAFGSIKTKPGHVLYLCGENPEDFKLRLRGALGSMGLSPDRVRGQVTVLPIADHLAVLSKQVLDFSNSTQGIALIIVDTSVAYFSYEDENKNVEARNHAQDLRDLVNALGGPAVLTLSHPAKNASRDNLVPRGGSGFLNEVDANLTAWKEGDTIELWHTKIRGPSFEPISCSLKKTDVPGVFDSEGRQVRTIVATPISDAEAFEVIRDDMTDADQLLVAMLYQQGGSVSDWARRLGWVGDTDVPNKAKVYRLLKILETDRLVEKNRKGWKLTKQGSDEADKLSKK